MYSKRVFFSFLTFFSLLIVRAQSSMENYKCYYTVGKSCPDFTFNHVVNYSKKKTSLGDFQGKWLILDFWSKDCSACIKNFPKINREQTLYKDNIQFLLVGFQDKEAEINLLYNRLKENLHLQVPCAFDSTLINQVNELDHGMPFFVIIDPEGVVRGDTWTMDLIDLNALTRTNRPVLPDYWREHFKLYKFDPTKPFLVNGNGGSDSMFLFRSLLSKWSTSQPSSGFPDSLNTSSGKLTIMGVNARALYMYAYTEIKLTEPLEVTSPKYGKIWPKPILEIKDSNKLKQIVSNERYCYSLTVPSEENGNLVMTRMMKQDLANYFGCKVDIEIKRMPYWRLIVSESAKTRLKSKNNVDPMVETPPRESGMQWQHYGAKNLDMSTLLRGIAYITQIEGEGTPILDETGITDHIDLNMEYKPFDLESITQALEKNGLKLIKGEREIKVLVIRD